jgi:hypothetical protein
MTMRNTVGAALLVALGLTLAVPALATPPGKTRLRAWMGFTTLPLGNLNDQVRSERNAFMGDTLTDESRWDPLGGAPNPVVELDVQLTPVLSAAIGYSSNRSSVRHEAFRIISVDEFGEPAETEDFDQALKVSTWDVVGTLGLWVPSAPGLHFGAQLGLARGTLTNESVHDVSAFSIPAAYTEFLNGRWTGTGLVLGAFTGYDQPISSQLSLTTRVGYRYRRIGRLDGIVRRLELDENEGTSYEWEPGPLRHWKIGPPGAHLDTGGDPMSLDLGGFYFNVGLSVGLGGGE